MANSLARFQVKIKFNISEIEDLKENKKVNIRIVQKKLTWETTGRMEFNPRNILIKPGRNKELQNLKNYNFPIRIINVHTKSIY